MIPDAAWPALPNYGSGGFTPEQNAAHTSPKGTPYPENLIPGTNSRKLAKLAMKIGFKPHLKFNKTKPTKKKKKNA